MNKKLEELCKKCPGTVNIENDIISVKLNSSKQIDDFINYIIEQDIILTKDNLKLPLTMKRFKFDLLAMSKSSMLSTIKIYDCEINNLEFSFSLDEDEKQTLNEKFIYAASMEFYKAWNEEFEKTKLEGKDVKWFECKNKIQKKLFAKYSGEDKLDYDKWQEDINKKFEDFEKQCEKLYPEATREVKIDVTNKIKEVMKEVKRKLT